jgi:hypothetical protein
MDMIWLLHAGAANGRRKRLADSGPVSRSPETFFFMRSIGRMAVRRRWRAAAESDKLPLLESGRGATETI